MSTRPSRDGLKPKGDKVGVCVSGLLNVARTIIQNDALPGSRVYWGTQTGYRRRREKRPVRLRSSMNERRHGRLQVNFVVCGP